MKASEALIAWTPDRAAYSAKGTRGQIRVERLGETPGSGRWTKPYAFTGGAAFVARRKLTGMDAVALVFIDFNTIVVRDGIDPQVAHTTFLAIDEYAERISADMRGARGNLSDWGLY